MTPTRTPMPIAEHALLSDRQGAALVARDGTVDWACLPRFDSAAVPAEILGPGAAQLGNFPQAFTHVGLINAAAAIGRAEDAARRP
jgi:GH15 family glucan-1,4-alpha-glucosidase